MLIRRPAKTKPLMVLLCVLAMGVLPRQACAVAIEENRHKLGGNFRIRVYANSEAEGRQSIVAAYRLVDSLNQALSSYVPDSEVSRLNRHKKLARPSIAMATLMARARAAYQRSDGYFDITIQPAIDQWRRAEAKNRPPRRRKLRKLANKHVGFGRAFAPAGPHGIQLKKNAAINVGGIAKGYIIDAVYQLLGQANLTAYLVDAAGDIRVFGSPPGQDSWVLGISSADKAMYQVRLRSGQAVATSGMAYRYFTIAGRRYSHIIDPKTLIPVRHHYAATVVAQDATTADFLASALNIAVDPEAARAIMAKNAGCAYMVFSDFRVVRQSPAFPIVQPQKLPQ